ncbi:MAG TPA: potassium/proton antiporter [Gaiellaceae bacterium]|nr:potassium/proton antiporter [Gaiellaceae bacterium]
MTEISDFGGIILVVTAGFTLAVLSTKLTERVPVPAPALFLAAAALVSDIWPSVYDALSIRVVERIAVVALVVILFNGGMDIGWRRFRSAAGPILSLGLLGTFATAGLMALFAHYALGLSWILSGLIAAAIAPTDPAVVFSVLGRREIEGRSGTTLEGEAGINDPVGIALMIGMIELATHDDASFLVVIQEFAIEMSIGAAFGVLGARLLTPILRRLELGSEGLYPVLAMTLAGALYGVTSIAHGSGFLAVFIAGLLLGDAHVPFKAEIERFSASLASLAELAVFVFLGLTIDLGSLSGRVWLEGAALALFLALLGRPLVVIATLGLARFRWGERLFISWAGLKGAVPILLAALALLSGVPDAQHVYRVVFVVVVVSVVGQGTLVPFAARLLGVRMHDRPTLPWLLARHPPAEEAFEVQAGSRAAGLALGDLPLGEKAWITHVIRNGVTIRPASTLELLVGDQVLLTTTSEQPDQLSRLFAVDGPETERPG